MAGSNGNRSASPAALLARGADSLLGEFAAESAGGQAAFAEVVRRYAAAVYATCLRVTKNTHDAEDATQVTFLTLALQVKAGKPVAKVGPWLQRVAQRAALDVRRARARREKHELRHAENRTRETDALHRDAGRNGQPVPVADAGEIGQVMAEELAKLPARYRLPLASLYCAGMDRAQIAAELGLTPHALRVRIHRGRQMLARRLASRGIGPASRLLQGGLLAAALAAVARRALVERAAAAAGGAAVPGDLVAVTTARVLATLNATFAAAALAKLKGVAGVAVLLGVSAVVAGRAAAANWASIEPHLPPVVRQVIEAVRSPWRVPLPERVAPVPTPVAVADRVRGVDESVVLRVPASRVPRETRGVDGRALSGAPGRPVVSGTDAQSHAAAALTAPRDAVHIESGPRPGAPAKLGAIAPPRIAAAPARRSPVAVANADAFRPHGATFSADAIDAARERGSVVHDDRTRFTPALHVGASADGSGAYHLADGALVVRPPAGGAATPGAPGVVIGASGDGALHLGGGNSRGGAIFQPRGPDSPRPVPVGLPRSIAPPPPSLVVRAEPNGSGLIEGWGGAIGDGGAFVNNGRVVADGGGRDRELIFLGYGAVTNTIDNDPAGGQNGWFARAGGRLFLPKIPVLPGTHTYTWGEDAADPTIDLVNSVRLTLHDAANPGKLEISLLDKTRADVPALPAGHTFIGVWSLDIGLTKPAGGIDLTVRYDDGLAHDLGLNESNLKLWQYDAGQWLRINDGSFARDLDHHLLSGHADPAATYFAVSAPEPSTWGTLGLASLLLLRRRRLCSEPPPSRRRFLANP